MCPSCWGKPFIAVGHGQKVKEAPEVGEALKPTNPKDRVATYRLDLSLFPAAAVAYGALACTEGHVKYDGYNWREAGVLWSVYDAAVRRHLDKYHEGEWEDSKTGVPHLASALACIAILIDAYESGMLKDDRPPRKFDFTHLLDRFEAKVKHLYETLGRGRTPNRWKQNDERKYQEKLLP
jgi:hypothetical protein